MLSSRDFSPSKERYLSLENVHMTSLFTAREEGKLVGYALFITCAHLQYSNTIWAQQDVMWMHPEHRGIASVNFIQYVDQTLKSDNVDVVLRHVNVMRDYSRTLERMGYKPVETSYIKEL